MPGLSEPWRLRVSESCENFVRCGVSVHLYPPPSTDRSSVFRMPGCAFLRYAQRLTRVSLRTPRGPTRLIICHSVVTLKLMLSCRPMQGILGCAGVGSAHAALHGDAQVGYVQVLPSVPEVHDPRLLDTMISFSTRHSVTTFTLTHCILSSQSLEPRNLIQVQSLTPE